MVQWLGLCTFTAEGMGSISGQGTKTPQATWPKQQQKQKKQTLYQFEIGQDWC